MFNKYIIGIIVVLLIACSLLLTYNYKLRSDNKTLETNISILKENIDEQNIVINQYKEGIIKWKQTLKDAQNAVINLNVKTNINAKQTEKLKKELEKYDGNREIYNDAKVTNPKTSFTFSFSNSATDDYNNIIILLNEATGNKEISGTYRTTE